MCRISKCNTSVAHNVALLEHGIKTVGKLDVIRHKTHNNLKDATITMLVLDPFCPLVVKRIT